MITGRLRGDEQEEEDVQCPIALDFLLVSLARPNGAKEEHEYQGVHSRLKQRIQPGEMGNRSGIEFRFGDEQAPQQRGNGSKRDMVRIDRLSS